MTTTQTTQPAKNDLFTTETGDVWRVTSVQVKAQTVKARPHFGDYTSMNGIAFFTWAQVQANRVES